MTNSKKIAVKTMLFKRGDDVATVVACVPEERFGNCKLVKNKDGKVHPNSCGVFIEVMGKDLFAPKCSLPLTKYESYLASQGWEFVCSVKEAYGNTVPNAFYVAHIYIRAYKAL